MVRAKSSLVPTLQAFKNERVSDGSDMSDFFGPNFFVDDWFPQWLTKRSDFLRLCPRFCENKKVFSSIAADIPSEYIVSRALRASPFMSQLDDVTIRSLTKKCIVSEHPIGHVIFHQGDVADGMFVVARGCVAIRMTVDGGVNDVARLKDGDVFGEVGC